MRTFLERAKGSMLDVLASGRTRAGTMDPLSSHTKQIRRLEFAWDGWANIKSFCKSIPDRFRFCAPSPSMAPWKAAGKTATRWIFPILPFFQRRQFTSTRTCTGHHSIHQSLRLVSVHLMAARSGNFRPSQLLNFLDTSPMLQTVHIKFIGRIPFNDISRDRVIVLRSLETFTVVSTDGRGDSEFATHTPCPSARSISIARKTRVSDAVVVEILPATFYWDTYIRQSTRSPVEDVTIEMKYTKSSPPLPSPFGRQIGLELRSHR